MNELLKPIKTESLKDIFVSRFEKLIISGKLSAGEKLPSERELVNRMKISRSVVHAGLLELASKELLTIKPQTGAVINDFKKEGTLSVLLPLVNYHGLKIKPNIQKNIIALRMLFETEAARLASQNRKEKHLKNLADIIIKENETELENIKEIAQLDYTFHLTIMEASGNFFFPLLFNSFKQIYLHLVELFYSDTKVCKRVFNYHKELYVAIKQKDKDSSDRIMTELLKHGAKPRSKTS